jgi:hypothetical protein
MLFLRRLLATVAVSATGTSATCFKRATFDVALARFKFTPRSAPRFKFTPRSVSGLHAKHWFKGGLRSVRPWQEIQKEQVHGIAIDCGDAGIQNEEGVENYQLARQLQELID